MNERLLIITKFFPFNNGEVPAESFFETEIYILAKLYKEVMVFAVDAPQGKKITVKLPDNVKAYAVGMKKSRMLFYIICKMLFIRKINVRDCKANTIRKKLYERYFIAKSNLYFQRIIKNNITTCEQCCTIYSFWFYTYARTAVLLSKMSVAKVFSRAHRYDLYEYRHKEDYIPMREYLLENLDYIFTCSEDGAKYLKKRYHQYSNKVVRSYLGSPDRGLNVQSESEQPFTIVSCSRIVPVKRLDKMLEVITLLTQMDMEIPFQWIHIGDGKKLEKIKKEAQGLIEQGKVVFLGGMSNKDVLKFYSNQHVDLFVNLSDSEGLPISIMEASSFGIPVFATDVGGTKEIVENGKNGCLVDHNFNSMQTAQQLKNIIMMMSNTEEKLQYGFNARNMWKQKFLVENNTERMISIVERK